MARIVLQDIDKQFKSTTVLNGINLDIADGEFLTLVGPSGCGKSTTLRIIAGLEQQSAGDVQIDGMLVNNTRPSARNLAMVFQSYALYPHLSVYDNIAVPLRMRHLGTLQRWPLLRWLIPGTRRIERQIREQIIDTTDSLGLTELLDRKPGQLSGGQRQRVAVGRAIVREPLAFLLDEPLSNLDAKMRVHMRTEITQLHRRLQTTFVYVTHDQAEAMTMSDRIAVMMDGEIVQLDTPDEIYHRPVDVRVARFIGSPAINLLPAANCSDGTIEVLQYGTSLRCDDAVDRIGIRPEYGAVSGSDTHGEHDLQLTGTVCHIENFGAEIFIQLAIDNVDEPLVLRSDPQAGRAAAIGDTMAVRLDLNHAMLFDRNGRTLQAAAPVASAVNA